MFAELFYLNGQLILRKAGKHGDIDIIVPRSKNECIISPNHIVTTTPGMTVENGVVAQ